MKLKTSYIIDPRRVAIILAAITAALVVVHVIAMQLNFNPYWGLKEKFGFHYWQIQFFDLDEEESFGTWFSAGILMISSVLLLHQARVVRATGEPGDWSWRILGFGFCFLSVDEVVGMHEFMNSMMDDDFPWTYVGGAIAGMVGLSFIPFLRDLPGRSAILFCVAGAIYVGGAVGVEHFTDSKTNSLHYQMWTALAEGMEMSGVVLFIYALLDHMRVGADGRLQIDGGRADGDRADGDRADGDRADGDPADGGRAERDA